MKKEIVIGIDGRALARKRTGKETYSSFLIKELISTAPKDWLFLIFSKRAIGEQFLKENVRNVVFDKPPPFWFLELKRLVEENGVSLFFSPESYFPGYLNFRNSVLVVHDLIPFINFRWSPFKSFLIDRSILGKALKNAKRVIAVSQTTLNDMERFFPGLKRKVALIYEGVGEEFHPRKGDDIEKLRRKYNLREEYLLYVGSLNRRKNVENLIRAYSLLDKSLRERFPLVIAGQGYLIGKLKGLSRRGELQVKFLGYVDPADLPVLYAGATLFVYLSFYEGFGLPVVEAMASGAPTLVSDIPVFREVVGNSSYYADPYNLKDIRSKIEFLLNSPEERERLKKLGLKRASLFSWKEAAKKTITLFKGVLNHLEE